MKQARFYEDPAISNRSKHQRRASSPHRTNDIDMDFWRTDLRGTTLDPSYPKVSANNATRGSSGRRRASMSYPSDDKRPEYNRDGIRVYAEETPVFSNTQPNPTSGTINPVNSRPVLGPTEYRTSAPINIPAVKKPFFQSSPNENPLHPFPAARPEEPPLHHNYDYHHRRASYGGSAGRRGAVDIDGLGLGLGNLRVSTSTGYGTEPTTHLHSMNRERHSQSSHGSGEPRETRRGRGSQPHSRQPSRETGEFSFHTQFGSTPSPRRPGFEVYRDEEDSHNPTNQRETNRHHRKRSSSGSRRTLEDPAAIPRRSGSQRERERTIHGHPTKINTEPYASNPTYNYHQTPTTPYGGSAGFSFPPKPSGLASTAQAYGPALKPKSANTSFPTAHHRGSQIYDSQASPQLKELFIAIMGVTGSGKSSFVRALTGSHRARIGHGLRSCTYNIEMYSTVIGNYKVNLIDTPGFDDLKRDETDILNSISAYLAKSYYEGAFLNGIIYLHRIQDVRIQGSALRCLDIFDKIVGMENMRNVLFVTTMWDSLGNRSGIAGADGISAQEIGERRERELCHTPGFWGRFLKNGAQNSRHYGTLDSAERLVKYFMPENHSAHSKIGQPMKLLLQKELIEMRIQGNHLRLEDTTVGQFINQELYKRQKQFEKEIEDIRKKGGSHVSSSSGSSSNNPSDELKKKRDGLREVQGKAQVLSRTVGEILPEAANKDGWICGLM